MYPIQWATVGCKQPTHSLAKSASYNGGESHGRIIHCVSVCLWVVGALTVTQAQLLIINTFNFSLSASINYLDRMFVSQQFFSTLVFLKLHIVQCIRFSPQIMSLKLEDFGAQRSFLFLWCGSCEGLDLGREVFTMTIFCEKVVVDCTMTEQNIANDIYCSCIQHAVLGVVGL